MAAQRDVDRRAASARVADGVSLSGAVRAAALCAKRYSSSRGSTVNLTVMAKSAVTNLKQLVSRLHEQELEMATLRTAIDVQFKRIAQMQAELDQLPHARRRRQALRPLLAERPSRNGRNPSRD